MSQSSTNLKQKYFEDLPQGPILGPKICDQKTNNLETCELFFSCLFFSCLLGTCLLALLTHLFTRHVACFFACGKVFLGLFSQSALACSGWNCFALPGSGFCLVAMFCVMLPQIAFLLGSVGPSVGWAVWRLRARWCAGSNHPGWHARL